MRYGIMGLAISTVLMILVMGHASAIDETTVDLTIAPGDKDGSPLVIFDTGTIDIKVTSNIPVDIYIIKGEEITNAYLGDDFLYEEKWEGRTSIEVDYDVQDLTVQHYILIHNTHGSETANVTLEYQLFEDIIQDEIEEAVEDAACGSVMILGIAGIAGILILAIFIRSRRE
ncbi:MAG: hypothetical protein ACMUIG_01080 [Thermoplasmatota archaeon]